MQIGFRLLEETGMLTARRVLVVGGGISGLAAAKAFQAHGHDVTVVEKASELGGVWDPARSYPGIRTQTPRDLYAYPDFPMPQDYPEWPSGAQVHAYLSRYAEMHGLRADSIRDGGRGAGADRRRRERLDREVARQDRRRG
jgi:cation diffusion facilitator CzcD-associated flavoprotein CzcO